MLLIFIGCGLGGLLRYWTSNLVYTLLGQGFPLGTLVVNVSGAFIMGFLIVLAQDKWNAVAIPLRAFMLIGLLGGYTTFSTFSVETLNLLETGDYASAILNVFLNVALCLIGAWAGLLLGRQ